MYWSIAQFDWFVCGLQLPLTSIVDVVIYPEEPRDHVYRCLRRPTFNIWLIDAKSMSYCGEDDTLDPLLSGCNDRELVLFIPEVIIAVRERERERERAGEMIARLLYSHKH